MIRKPDWLPYWGAHFVVASAISVATLSPIAGAMFYIGREVRDREKLGRWDMPGLLAPAVPWCAAHVVVMWKIWPTLPTLVAMVFG